MANDYTTSTDAFADISEGNYSSSDYPQMASFVTVASRLIDREVGRQDGFFYPTTSDVTMYYNGSGGHDQEIDEFVSITSVSVAEQGGLSSSDYTAWTLNTDYVTYPYNASVKGKPIYRLELEDSGGNKAAWYSYQKGVKVVGVAGYSATPPDLVVQACKRQAVRWFMQAKQGYQDSGTSAEVGGLVFKRGELDKDIRQMLMPFVMELDR